MQRVRWRDRRPDRRRLLGVLVVLLAVRAGQARADARRDGQAGRRRHATRPCRCSSEVTTTVATINSPARAASTPSPATSQTITSNVAALSSVVRRHARRPADQGRGLQLRRAPALADDARGEAGRSGSRAELKAERASGAPPGRPDLMRRLFWLAIGIGVGRGRRVRRARQAGARADARTGVAERLRRRRRRRPRVRRRRPRGDGRARGRAARRARPRRRRRWRTATAADARGTGRLDAGRAAQATREDVY